MPTFPSNPAVGDEVGVWRWDGTKWNRGPARGYAIVPDPPADHVYGRRDDVWQVAELALVGTISEYAAGFPLAPGWLPCDGRSLVRTTYARLFAVIGTTYGSASGTTFNIPDLRGRATIGQGGTWWPGGVPGDVWGHEGMPSHNHGVYDPGHGHNMHDPGHTHGFNDPWHVHTLNQSAHGHTVNGGWHGHGRNDPGHSHYHAGWHPGGFGWVYGVGAGPVWGLWMNNADSGVSIHGAGTGIWYGENYAWVSFDGSGVWASNSPSGTGQWVYGEYTGITLSSVGVGNSGNTQPSIIQMKMIYAGLP
jgi:hypothetical protein